MSFAKITLKGRLGKEPELKQVGQSQVCKLSVATSERWIDQQGNRQEKTTWHNVEFWGKQAETVAKYFHKGDEIVVFGNVTSDEWTDQQGQKRTTQKVKGYEFDFVGSGQNNQQQPQQQWGNQQQQQWQNPQQPQQFNNGQPVPPAYQNYPQHAPQNPQQQQPLMPQAGAVDDDIPF